MSEEITISEKSLKDTVVFYTRKWKWFLFSLILVLSLAYAFIRYSPPKYEAVAQIQILEERGASPELSVFQDLDLFSGAKNKVEDEIRIIGSRSNFLQVVQELGLNVSLYELGKITDSEIYSGDFPFKINFIEPDSVIFKKKHTFYIDLLDKPTTFRYSEEDNSPGKLMAFGKNIDSPIGNVLLTPNNENLNKFENSKIRVEVRPIDELARYYKSKTTIREAEELSNIINLNLEDPVQQKAVDILASLIKTYNTNAVGDKKAIADKTSEFIDNRIADIYGDLSQVDQSAETYKSGRGITDVASQSNINLNVGAANKQELENASVQLNIAASMKDYVDGQSSHEVLPSNIGLSDPSIANTTAKYNELVLERNRLLKSSNEKNPIIVNLDEQLNGLKRTLESSLNSITNNLGLKVNNLSSQQSSINARIYAAPKNERALRDITRRQQTTESLYLYLLQKREEAQISYASAAPKSKTVDNAYANGDDPISPRKKIIYMAAFIFGLAIPFSIFYVSDLLDNKVKNKVSFEKIVKNVPVLAEFPELGRREDKLLRDNDRSILSESFRIFRTNLDYIIKSKRKETKKSNLIFVTSSVSGEGKTFVSTNLAMIIATTNKRVLLVGADVRNPKIYSFFDDKNIDRLKTADRSKDKGLTDFLFDDSLNLRDVTTPMLAYSNSIDVVYSGKIPPNPAELLMNKRIGELFSKASDLYDYVIVDTAPLMLVTDTLLISEYADHTVYVVRAGVTENKIVEFPIKLKKEGKLKGLSFVVNDVKQTNLGYSGKYGYGYVDKPKRRWF